MASSTEKDKMQMIDDQLLRQPSDLCLKRSSDMILSLLTQLLDNQKSLNRTQ